MRLLLDTHSLLWWYLADGRLPRRALEAIAEADAVFVSAVSAMEITTKHRLGKLAPPDRLIGDFETAIADEGFIPLAVELRHGLLGGSLKIPHKDPFDRLLIAQSLVERLTLVSNEQVFDGFGVSRLW